MTIVFFLCNTPSNYPIVFEDSEISPLNFINILGLQIFSRLSWKDHIVQIAKSASKKLGVLFQCKQYFNSVQLFKLCTGFIHHCLEYCCHIWGSSPYTSFVDKVESKDICLTGDPSLTSTLDPLSLRRKVASLSLLYCLGMWVKCVHLRGVDFHTLHSLSSPLNNA